MFYRHIMQILTPVWSGVNEDKGNWSGLYEYKGLGLTLSEMGRVIKCTVDFWYWCQLWVIWREYDTQSHGVYAKGVICVKYCLSI